MNGTVDSRSRGVLSIGECMVEMALREDGAYMRSFAGDTFNTAWYLRRLLGDGTDVDYCSAVGEDAISSQMLAFMREAGVGTSFIRRMPTRTVGLYLIELANGERNFMYWRENSAARLLAEDRNWLATAMAGRGLIVFSGITLAILSPDHRHVLLDALAGARGDGATIAFDPNMRLRLWPSQGIMVDAIIEAARGADIVLPSFDEDGVFFDDDNPEQTIRRYRSLGVRTVAVKNGGAPVFAWDEAEGSVEVPVQAAPVVDTTAAGDSFNAGFLAARMKGRSLREAIKSGAQLAGKVIGKRGALVEVGD